MALPQDPRCLSSNRANPCHLYRERRLISISVSFVVHCSKLMAIAKGWIIEQMKALPWICVLSSPSQPRTAPTFLQMQHRGPSPSHLFIADMNPDNLRPLYSWHAHLSSFHQLDPFFYFSFNYTFIFNWFLFHCHKFKLLIQRLIDSTCQSIHQ